MRFIVSRRGKRYHDISKMVSDAVSKESGSIDKDDVFRKFHYEIACDYHVSHLCKENMLNPEDLEKIVNKMMKLGISWHRGYFVPVSTFTYVDTFSFLMNHMHKLNETDCHEIKEYLYKFF